MCKALDDWAAEIRAESADKMQRMEEQIDYLIKENALLRAQLDKAKDHPIKLKKTRRRDLERSDRRVLMFIVF